MMEKGDCTLGDRKGQSKGTYIDCPPEATGFVLPHLNFTVTVCHRYWFFHFSKSLRNSHLTQGHTLSK